MFPVDCEKAEQSERTSSHGADARQARYRAFLERWTTDVAPVHERTERSREFRAQYARLALTSVLVTNGAAVLVFPAVARLVGAPVAGQMRLFLLGEGAFLLGAALALLAMLLAYATLDVDVTRQKGERAAARGRLIEAGFAEQFPEAPEAESVRSEAHQRMHWRLGVAMAWIAMAITLGAFGAFVAGGLLAGQFLARAAG